MNVVASDVEVLDESIGGGEAVGKGNSVDGKDGVLRCAKTFVLEAVHKAENVGAAGGGIDGEARHNCYADGATERSLVSILSRPAETIGVHMAFLVQETGETSAEVSLETILGCIDSLLGPSGSNSGVSTLQSIKYKLNTLV